MIFLSFFDTRLLVAPASMYAAVFGYFLTEIHVFNITM